MSTLQPRTFGGGAGRADIVVRTTGDPNQSVGAVRTAIHDIDKDLPLARVTTMDDLVSASMGQRRLSTILPRRLRRSGTSARFTRHLWSDVVCGGATDSRARRAGGSLGATRENVLGLVLRQGITLTLAGAAVGLAGAFALTRLIAAQLYSVKATDPATFALGDRCCCLSARACGLHCWCRRSGRWRVDPTHCAA